MSLRLLYLIVLRVFGWIALLAVNGQVRVAAGGQVKVPISQVFSAVDEASSCPGSGLAHAERLAFGDHDDAVVQETIEQADGGGVFG
jgi:hypothetical protein